MAIDNRDAASRLASAQQQIEALQTQLRAAIHRAQHCEARYYQAQLVAEVQARRLGPMKAYEDDPVIIDMLADFVMWLEGPDFPPQCDMPDRSAIRTSAQEFLTDRAGMLRAAEKARLRVVK